MTLTIGTAPRSTSRRPRLALAAALLLGVGAHAASDQEAPGSAVVRTSQHDFRVETVVPALVHPFAMAFTPEGDMLVTERPGRLRIVRKGTLLPDPVAGLPEILALGKGAASQDGREQAGLRDVVLHPGFATNRLLYISYVKPGEKGFGNLAVARGRFEHDRLSNVQEIFHAIAPGNGTNRSSMWGGRMVFDKQGYLFVTLGDRQWPAVGDLTKHPAQDLSRHNGTTIRLHDDGRVPADNPFVGRRACSPDLHHGHRNAQGTAVHPVTGDIWQNEHGPQGGDEAEPHTPGLNYGWPSWASA
jgi:glucose/arabinose dehydrogenase